MRVCMFMVVCFVDCVIDYCCGLELLDFGLVFFSDLGF